MSANFRNPGGPKSLSQNGDRHLAVDFFSDRTLDRLGASPRFGIESLVETSARLARMLYSSVQKRGVFLEKNDT